MINIRVIAASGVLSPARVVSPHSMDATHGIDMLNAADADISKSGFFRKQFQEKQSQWKPLSPNYVKEKVEEGLPRDIWRLSGSTLKALSIPVMVNSSNMYGRTSRLVFNSGYAAECVWLIGYPSASGWPGHKGSRSFFDHNNRIRPIDFTLDKATVERVERAMAKSIEPFWKMMMIKYFGVSR